MSFEAFPVWHGGAYVTSRTVLRIDESEERVYLDVFFRSGKETCEQIYCSFRL